MTENENPKFPVSQGTLVVIIVIFVISLFLSIIAKAFISGHM